MQVQSNHAHPGSIFSAQNAANEVLHPGGTRSYDPIEHAGAANGTISWARGDGDARSTNEVLHPGAANSTLNFARGGGHNGRLFAGQY